HVFRQPLISTLFPYTTLFRSSSVRSLIVYFSTGLIPTFIGINLLLPVLSNKNSSSFVVPKNILSLGFVVADFPNFALYVSWVDRSEEHTSELQSRFDLVCRLL